MNYQTDYLHIKTTAQKFYGKGIVIVSAEMYVISQML